MVKAKKKNKTDIAKFATGMARLFSVQALGLGCGFLVHLFLASKLSAADYGVYNFVFSTSMICALIGNFGFQASAVRLVPQIITDKDPKTLKDFFTFTAVWIFMLSSFVSMAVYQLLSYLDFTAEYSREALLIGIGLTPLLALLKLNSGILKGFKKGSWALAYESSLKEILLFTVLAGTAVFAYNISNAKWALFLTGLILAFLLVFSFVHILRLITSQMKLFPSLQTGKKFKPSYKIWLSLSFPMMLVISVQFLIIRSDVLMLGILTSALDVGVYSAGAKIAQAATISMMILNIFFSPRAAEFYHQNKHVELRSLYFQTLQYQAATTLLLILCLAFSAPYIINFLGGDYANALNVIYILLIGYAFNCLWGPIPFLMIMTRYEYEAMWLTFGAALFNILLNLYLIPHYGITGAAISTVIALNLRNGTAFFYIQSKGLFSKEARHE